MSQNHCHIKRHPTSPQKSNACDPTLCGKEGPGLYVYETLGRDDQIPDTAFPICPTCAARHIEERYPALRKAQGAFLN